MQKPSTKINLNPSPKPIKTTPKVLVSKPETSDTGEISSKATSPTLVEFQSRNAQLPEWRLQLKNAVQKRKGTNVEYTESVLASRPNSPVTASAKSYPTSGGNALKVEYYEEAEPQPIDNEKLAKALKRIEKSREKFYISEVAGMEIPVEVPEPEKPVRDFPFKIASRNENPSPQSNEDLKDSVNFPPKPKLVKPRNIGLVSDLYNTSELDPNFAAAKISSSFSKYEIETKKVKTEKDSVETAPTAVIEKAEITVEPAAEVAVVDDIAPFSLRFNAGLFDLIIGTFSSLILLSPFMLLGGNWFTMTGFVGFLATCAIVMFIYMTTTTGLFGKTFGMHLFSLEMIDYTNDEYPNFHQAAVSSSVYLLSIAFAGVGFITYFFDPDRRAVHDLVSGTLIVKEI